MDRGTGDREGACRLRGAGTTEASKQEAGAPVGRKWSLRLTGWTRLPRGTVRRKKRAAEGPSRGKGRHGSMQRRDEEPHQKMTEIQERARRKGRGRGAHGARRQRGVSTEHARPSCGKVRSLTRSQVHSVAQEFNVHLLCLALFRPKRKESKRRIKPVPMELITSNNQTDHRRNKTPANRKDHIIKQI